MTPYNSADRLLVYPFSPRLSRSYVLGERVLEREIFLLGKTTSNSLRKTTNIFFWLRERDFSVCKSPSQIPIFLIDIANVLISKYTDGELLSDDDELTGYAEENC